MKLFAIGDLHLSHSSNKPMSIFGPNWDNHAERIAAAWRERVSDEDAVLIPGDISWAMQLDEARLDIEYIAALPGKKVIMRGNHDYWWGSISKVRDMLPCCMYALQNDTVELGSVTIAGSRGWICPGSSGFDSETDQKIYDREVIRLQLSLSGATGQPHHRHAALPPIQRETGAKRLYGDIREVRRGAGDIRPSSRQSLPQCVRGHPQRHRIHAVFCRPSGFCTEADNGDISLINA